MSDNKNNNMSNKAKQAKRKTQQAAQKAGNAVTRTVKDPKTWAFISGLATGVASVVGWQYYNQS